MRLCSTTIKELCEICGVGVVPMGRVIKGEVPDADTRQKLQIHLEIPERLFSA